MFVATLTVTSSGRNAARAVGVVHTTAPAHCAFVTVAVTVASASCVTGGAVHVAVNRPFASVSPDVGFRFPADGDKSTVTLRTGVPVESCASTVIPVVEPATTVLETEPIETVRAPSGGCNTAQYDHGLLIPPKLSTQPENAFRSNASSVS